MKKLLFLGMIAMLTACSESEISDFHPTSGLDIQTSITQEAITRASLSGSVSRVNAIVLDGDGAIVTQTVTDATSDAVSVDLEPGDYTLLLVANAGQAPTVNTDGTCTYTKVGDAFSCWKSVTVARDKRTSVSAELSRCVAKLTFKSTDQMPDEVTKVTFSLSNISDTYDIENHKGTNSDKSYGNTVAVSSYKQTDGTFSCYIYTLIPAESISNGTLSLSFLDTSGNAIYTCTYDDLPLTQNRNTVLTAPFFHENGGDATVSLNTAWGEDINVER